PPRQPVMIGAPRHRQATEPDPETMLHSPRTLFVIHRFDAKPLSDSAGVIEVMNPMLASGLLGEHRMISLGRDTADYLTLIEAAVERAARIAAGAPVVIYGAGAHTRQFHPQLRRLRIAAVADRDPSLWGTRCM